MSQDKNQQPGVQKEPLAQQEKAGNKGVEASTSVGIGEILRREREKKGLTYNEIFEITRVRPSILDALENEDWDVLPSRVFVTGFVRSYARALGLEEEELVALYHKAAPSEKRPSRPDVKFDKPNKGLIVLVAFSAVAVLSAYFLFKKNPTNKEISVKPTMVISASNDFIPVPKDQLDESSLAPVKTSQPVETGTPDEDLVSSEPEQAPPKDKPSEMVLKANVSDGTWVKIYVDGKKPKEYIFRAGSRHEWRAKHGFELIIGNAGGIGFEFNDEKIENLGQPGQVVRLKLPEDYVGRNGQD